MLVLMYCEKRCFQWLRCCLFRRVEEVVQVHYCHVNRIKFVEHMFDALLVVLLVDVREQDVFTKVSLEN